jgi:hypothetical protein
VSDLLTRAELTRLARVLGAAEAAVEFLAAREHLELRELESRVSAALFDEHRPAFQRLADASRLLPASLVAKVSELVFGPMLSARVAGLMPPARAVEVATQLRPRFLADVCMQLDPRSAAELLALIPAPIVVGVAKLLLERGEFMTMGRFVDDLPDAAIRAVIRDVSDDAALVRIAGFVERRERLIELVEMIPPERLPRVVATVAAGPPDVQRAGLAMMSQLSERQQGRLGDLAIALGAEPLKALAAAASREGANDVIRTVLRHVSVDSRRALEKILPGFVG